VREAVDAATGMSSGRGRLLIALAIGLGVMATLGRVASAALLSYAPLLLIALSPLPAHMLLVVPLTAIVPFVAVGASRRLVAGAVGYALGVEYGERGIAWAKKSYPRLAPLIDFLCTLFRRAGPVVLFIAPGPPFCALAGATAMRFWVFLPVALCGEVAWLVITYQVGDALREFIVPMLAFISEHLVSVTVGLAVIAGLIQWRRRRARRRNNTFTSLRQDPTGR